MQAYDETEALVDPVRYFGSPAAVCSSALDTDKKIALLRSWERNTRQLMVAEGEGLAASSDSQDPSGDLLKTIHAALASLGAPHNPEKAQTDGSGSGC